MRSFFSLFLVGISILKIHAQDITPAVQQGHYGPIKAIAVSPDQKVLASVGNDGQLIIWDLNSGMQLKRKMIYTLSAFYSIYFAEPSRLLFSANGNTTAFNAEKNEWEGSATAPVVALKGISLTDGEYGIQIKGPEISFSKDGAVFARRTSRFFNEGFTQMVLHKATSRVYVSSLDGKIYVYNYKKGKIEDHLALHQSAVNDLELSPDEKKLYSGSSDRTIIEWDLQSGKMLRRFYGYSYRVTAVNFTSQYDKLVFGDEIGNLKFFDMGNYSQEIKTFKISDHPLLQVIPQSQDQLLIVSPENKIRSFSISTEKTGTLHKYHRMSWKLFQQSVFEHVLGMYMEPRFTSFYYSSNEKNSVEIYAGNEKYNRNRRKVVIKKSGLKKRKNIRDSQYYIQSLSLINDSTFAVLRSDSGSFSIGFDSGASQLEIWLLRGNTLHRKQLVPSSSIEDMIRWDESSVLTFNRGGGLTVYQVFTNEKFNLDVNIPSAGDAKFIRKKNLIGIATQSDFYLLKFEGYKQWKYLGKFAGHDAQINDFDFSPVHNILVTASNDASLKFWNTENQQLISTLIPTGKKDFILVDPEGNYQITKNAYKKFGFCSGMQFIFPDQFDLRYNRPDVLLSAMGIGDKDLHHLLSKAYLKRLKRMGFTREELTGQSSLPEISITKTEKEDQQITLWVTAKDEIWTLDRINLLVNDVPIFGSKGFYFSDSALHRWDGSLTVPLLDGKNKIEVSVLNKKGTESVRKSLFAEGKNSGKPNLYLVALGVGQYADTRFNLTYPGKDAMDIQSTYTSMEGKFVEKVFSLCLKDSSFQLSTLPQIRTFLQDAKPNDYVVMFYAGHGVLDADLNYYLGTYSINFQNPKENGLSYENFEALVDGIKPLRKLIYIDACHSGEVDKEEVEQISMNTEGNGDIRFRTAGAGIQKKNLGLKSTSELMAELFTDLRKGTGATIISSAGGAEYAMESSNWKNGLFTYCLINGIRTKKADLNRDGEIVLSELQQFLRKEVVRMSNGMQQPTSRMENPAMDFRCW